MIRIISCLLISLCFLTSNAQSLAGTFKGKCVTKPSPGSDETKSNITIVLTYSGGNVYNGIAYETFINSSNIKYKNTFYFKMFELSSGEGIIPIRYINNIHIKSSSITRTFPEFSYEIEDLWSSCLCDDTRKFYIARDSIYEYLETECNDQMVYWSLARYLKLDKS